MYTNYTEDGGMKQFQFTYNNEEKFRDSLNKIKHVRNSLLASTVLFTILVADGDKQDVKTVVDIIRNEIPDALYMGCSGAGNIVMGDFCEDEIAIICSLYEYSTTMLSILQLPMATDEMDRTVDTLLAEVRERPWVKSVTLMTTIRGMSMTRLCERLSELPEDIQLFGGGAFSTDMLSDDSYVFSSSGGFVERGIVFLLTGGDDYYVSSSFIAGWKPLGRGILVTKAEGCTLYELDGEPAYDTYYRYLKIKNDEMFFINTLEFPFFYEYNGIDILRAPTKCNPDGSLTMTADISEDVNVRIAYGDPETIYSTVYDKAVELQEFGPEAVSVYSCAARKTFWGDAEVGKETLPFQMVAPTSGFYTSGEFLRTGGFVNQHNVTLVIAAQREGAANPGLSENIRLSREAVSRRVSMINRLANFIQAATEELEEANRTLARVAVSDGLTGLLNRTEIQHRITARSKEKDSDLPASVIMMDIDDFKAVNDTFGHREGDNVLRMLSTLLRDVIEENNPKATVGRWGGEEFMILLPNMNAKEASIFAEMIRERFAALQFPKAGRTTMSLGVAQLIPGETSDAWCMRADAGLYEAKKTGKDKVVVASS